MSHAWIIAHKEFRTYFRTPIAYVFLILFLVVTGWLFFWMGAEPFFKRGILDMRKFFGPLPIVFLFFIPAVSMRMWSEEKKQGTLEILLTMPLREFDVVLGKFLAGALLLLVSLALTFPLPLILGFIGSPDWGPIWGGYLGAFFLGAAFIAIGLFASSLTENQIIAFLLSVVFCFVFSFWGLFSLQGLLPAGLERFFMQLSLYTHFESIQRGVLDSRDLLYYGSVILFFLFLNMMIVRHRR